MDKLQIEQVSRQWLEEIVIGLNLCPFARRELVNNRVRFAVSEADSEEALLRGLQEELRFLEEHPDTETTLLIHPGVLTDFDEYNDFLAAVDGLLQLLELEGIYQVASFHPDYRFAGTGAEDAENYTNRSPYPMLHLLREASVERAVDSHPNPDAIPERNIAVMAELGADDLRQRLARIIAGNA
ncbi:DUF1415 domain-containing protein [Marinobacter confluentis]|uniref:DUF1415 domain-containing protein n=1 Tax=Marinobacter confluentis TaxID=1697557 RepID=A0A4Z1C9R2_9GAMM|nr:DUF1415 domain-containing protein [Marinobacter confluentis]TGN40156.1 DUF1415 domain-containing protein [Marinobacter confluentis]